MYTQSMFCAETRKITNFFLIKFSVFTAEKNLCILHGQGFLIKATTTPELIGFNVSIYIFRIRDDK